MLYTHLKDSGDSFEPERNLMQVTFGLDGGGSIGADREGNVYVAWHAVGVHDVGQGDGEARRQVWVAKSDTDGRTFSKERKAWQERTGACGCCGMKLIAGPGGTVNALYRSARESIHRDIYILRSNDRTETFEGRLLHPWEINACPMSSMDLAERRGDLLAAWETGGQAYWVEVGAGQDRSSEPTPAPGERGGRKHARLTTNSEGEVLFVWTEGTGWQRGGSLAWQHYDRDGSPTEVSGGIPGIPTWSFAAPVACRDGGFVILY